MRLGRNLLAGLANSAWTALVGLAVVPLYLKYLGIEAYGLIGFFATTQVILQLLDLGLAPTINREVARFTAAGDAQGSATLLHTLAMIYWGMAGVIALIVISAAPFIAQYWLQSEYLPKETIEHAVMLMGLVVACRWPIGIYQGALMGSQRLTVSSSINITMVTLGSFGAVSVLVFLSPTIEAFFTWQAIVGFINAAVVRWAAWRVVGKSVAARFDVAELKRIWRFSAGVSGVAISALVLMQLDKVLLSKILSLEDFGRYTLAVLAASGLYVLLTPVFNAIYPRFSALVAAGDTGGLIDLYRWGTRGLLAIVFPVAFAGIILSQELIYLWTGNIELAYSTAPIVSVILIGTSLNGAMHFPYALQLAFGMTRLPLTINAILVAVFGPMIVLLAIELGAIGGAIAWALLNGLYLFVGTWLTHRSLLVGLGAKWLFEDVGIPLGISLFVMSAVGWELQKPDYPVVVKLLVVCVSAFLAFALIVLVSPRLKSIAWGYLSRLMFNKAG